MKHQLPKLLIVTEDYPFPPRNGVTIPIAGLITLLQDKTQLDLLILLQKPEDREKHVLTSKWCTNLYVEKRKKQKTFRAACGELFLHKPIFHAYCDEGCNLDFAKYEKIISGPISTLGFALTNRIDDQPVYAAISDSCTSMYRSLTFPGWTVKNIVRFLAIKIRGLYMGRIEATLLASCHKVIVQTSQDKEWIRKIGGNKLANKTEVLSNGVNDILLSRKISASLPPPVVLFMASFESFYYKERLIWFYHNCWKKISTMQRGATLRIVGRGLNKNDKITRELKNDPSVQLLHYVEDIRDAYCNVCVAVAPVFKSYGFINKVAEALAAGVPVVADTNSFKGQSLDEALSYGCGRVADNKDQFVSEITYFLTLGDKWFTVSGKAKKLAGESLSWESKRDLILDIFNLSNNAESIM